LYRAATNASFGIGDAGGRTKQLLSFEIEPAGVFFDVPAQHLYRSKQL
jgi:hypothetical protein